MFKKLLLALAVALPLSTMAQKFGVVDLNAVFTSMPEAAEMQKKCRNFRSSTNQSFRNFRNK